MIDDTYCNPVVSAAGFAETDLPDDAHVYMAVRFLMRDAAVEPLANLVAETLGMEARQTHAGTEPPLTEGMPDEAFVEWCEWYEKATAGGKPYESLIMALQMLKPRERAEVRERVLATIKAAEVVQ